MLCIDGSFKSIGHVSLDRLSLGLTDRSGIIMTTIEPPKREDPYAAPPPVADPTGVPLTWLPRAP